VSAAPYRSLIKQGKETARLVEDEIMNKQRLQDFIKTDA
jgi:hypothetical protein